MERKLRPVERLSETGAARILALATPDEDGEADEGEPAEGSRMGRPVEDSMSGT